MKTIPLTLVAGDSWFWCDTSAFASHPPPNWAVHYILRPVSGGVPTTIISTPAPAAFNFTATPSITSEMPAGSYEWTALAYGADDARKVLASGRLEVMPDPAAHKGDLRSRSERTLDAINATIEGRATKDADAYSIEGRSITRTPLPDLLRLQAIYERRVDAERNPGKSPISYRRISM
ncbi:hypothetical protein [Roseobacter litoralis]|uniref:hypothetical protein n=1 Tax=Roseobacter litoralis TaxID=42443 RepID=UPI002495312D|nr:hypothetical protein [Roseobacter litoralis]